MKTDMLPAQILSQFALGLFSAGIKLMEQRQQAEDESREITWEDVDKAVQANNSLRAEFEKNRSG